MSSSDTNAPVDSVPTSAAEPAGLRRVLLLVANLLRRLSSRCSNLTAEDLSYVIALWLLVIVIGAAWAKVLFASGAAIPYPLDDSFIYQRYARLLARGEFFAYNPGEGMTSGATSPLWALLAAVPYAAADLLQSAGVRVPMAAVWGFAGALGFTLMLLTVAGVYELTKRATHCLAGVGAALLVTASGYVIYFSVSGMETPLYAWLLVATIVAAARLEQRPSNRARIMLLVPASLLPWARPEGLLVLSLVVIWLVWRDRDLQLRGVTLAMGEADESTPVATPVIWWTAQNSAPVGGWRLPSLAIVGLAFIPWAGWMLAMQLGTGTMEPNGHALKGLLSNPTATMPEKLGFIGDALGALFTRFYANDFEYVPLRNADALFHPPWLLAIATLGFLPSAVRRGESLARPGFVLLTLATILVGIGSTTLNESYWSHNYRYQAPYQPLLLVGYALGLWWLSVAAARILWRDERTAPAAEKPVATDKHRRTPTELRRDSIFTLSTVAMTAVLGSSLPWWASFYGRNASDITNQHRLLMQAYPEGWVDREPSREENGELHRGDSADIAEDWWFQERIGLTDAGVMPYFRGFDGDLHHQDVAVYDYAGLVTNGQARWIRAGLGSLWESIERMPANRRPTMNTGYGAVIARPDGMHFMGTRVSSTRLIDNTVTGGETMTLWFPPWREPELTTIHRGVAWAFPRDVQSFHDRRVFERTDQPLMPRWREHPLVASFDVADLDDEARITRSPTYVPHPLRRQPFVENPGPALGTIDPWNTFLVEREPNLLIDGGRVISLVGESNESWAWRDLPLEDGATYVLLIRTAPVPSWIGETIPWIHLNAGGERTEYGLHELLERDPETGALREAFYELQHRFVAQPHHREELWVSIDAGYQVHFPGLFAFYHAFLVGPIDPAEFQPARPESRNDEALRVMSDIFDKGDS